jgi:hypothetical protein
MYDIRRSKQDKLSYDCKGYYIEKGKSLYIHMLMCLAMDSEWEVERKRNRLNSFNTDAPKKHDFQNRYYRMNSKTLCFITIVTYAVCITLTSKYVSGVYIVNETLNDIARTCKEKRYEKGDRWKYHSFYSKY